MTDFPPYIPDVPDQPKTVTSWGEVVGIVVLMTVVIIGAAFWLVSL